MFFDHFTGRPIDGWMHTLQCVDVIFETRIGERVMLRWFGGALQPVLGRKLTDELLSRAVAIFALAISLWEPRLRVVSVTATGSVEEIRIGDVVFEMLVGYRPRGHLGDFREETRLRNFGFGANASGFGVILGEAA